MNIFMCLGVEGNDIFMWILVNYLEYMAHYTIMGMCYGNNEKIIIKQQLK